MKTEISQLLNQCQQKTATFNDVISYIENLFTHQPTAFKNGMLFNDESQNQGSAKVLMFGKINELTQPETLSLFCEHFDAVLNEPDGSNHQNIRQFMAHGWEGVEFKGRVLILK